MVNEIISLYCGNRSISNSLGYWSILLDGDTNDRKKQEEENEERENLTTQRKENRFSNERFISNSAHGRHPRALIYCLHSEEENYLLPKRNSNNNNNLNNLNNLNNNNNNNNSTYNNNTDDNNNSAVWDGKMVRANISSNSHVVATTNLFQKHSNVSIIGDSILTNSIQAATLDSAWKSGYDLFSLDSNEEHMDMIRKQVEDCERLSCFQLYFDTEGFFAGFGSSLSQYLADEYPKKSSTFWLDNNIPQFSIPNPTRKQKDIICSIGSTISRISRMGNNFQLIPSIFNDKIPEGEDSWISKLNHSEIFYLGGLPFRDGNFVETFDYRYMIPNASFNLLTLDVLNSSSNNNNNNNNNSRGYFLSYGGKNNANDNSYQFQWIDENKLETPSLIESHLNLQMNPQRSMIVDQNLDELSSLLKSSQNVLKETTTFLRKNDEDLEEDQNHLQDLIEQYLSQ